MRLTQLDGLRGVAVLLVVASHVAESVVPYGGIVGVTTFFVLSGFVITRALIEESERTGRIALGGFWLRRAARLLPASLLVTAAAAVGVVLLDDPLADDLGRVLLTTLTYTANFARSGGGDLGVLEHTWSLAVEEQFYLVWPLVLIALLAVARRRPRAALAVLLALVAAALGWRVFATVALPFDRLAYSLDTCAAALLVGALCSIGVRCRVPARMSAWWGTGAFVVLVLLAACTVPVATGSLPGAARWVETAVIPVAALVVTAAATGAVPVLDRRVLWWFGTISYGLYLWHYPMLRISPGGDETTGVVRVGLAVVAVLVAAASWYVVERPLIVLVRRRLAGRRTGAATATATAAATATATVPAVAAPSPGRPDPRSEPVVPSPGPALHAAAQLRPLEPRVAEPELRSPCQDAGR